MTRSRRQNPESTASQQSRLRPSLLAALSVNVLKARLPRPLLRRTGLAERLLALATIQGGRLSATCSVAWSMNHACRVHGHAPRASVLGAILALGCADLGGLNLGGDSADLHDSSASPEDSQTDSDGWDAPDPSWWVLEATVLMEEALPVAGDVQLTISLLDETADPDLPLCSSSFEPQDIADQASPDPMIFHWWQLTLGQADPDSDCDAHFQDWLPDTLDLGVGELHPDIAALLEPAGYGSVQDYLYGAYVHHPSSKSIWAFGIAATPAGFASEVEPVDAAPVPAGTYLFTPIYLLPVEGL